MSKLTGSQLKMTKPNAMTGEELGEKLLQSVREMKAGKAARATQVAPNEVAAARPAGRCDH